MRSRGEWWLCPNIPRCPHGRVLHDSDDDERPPACCFENCTCGKPDPGTAVPPFQAAGLLSAAARPGHGGNFPAVFLTLSLPPGHDSAPACQDIPVGSLAGATAERYSIHDRPQTSLPPGYPPGAQNNPW